MSQQLGLITIRNPFTGEDTRREMPGMTDVIAQVEFDAMKDFIRDQLGLAKDEPNITSDSFKLTKLQHLIVQMYQPNNVKELFTKLEKFREYLSDVPQFKKIYDHFYSSDAAEKIPAQIIQCGGCTGTYAVSSHATAADTLLFTCPWCRSRQWTFAPADMKVIKPTPKPDTQDVAPEKND